ncbi:acyl-CoA carboxylase epsilon subunit [Cellulomonas massiliensis]|uniref:acyl-CoA carboxylase epsilon subunit n=1 Tax=Cellulomonas massiliensis TaxID=1465811 RepID=UPI0002E8B0AD|nr:acyl-CoA carboxylase epsilon subunit [Cellulomonas massiliensis]
MTTDHADRAHVHVVRGAPDEVELAALVAGLLATAPVEDPALAHPPAWTDHRRWVRGPVASRPGPDAWRWSLRG